MRARARGRLTSPVGGARKPGSPLGMKASQLQIRMKKKMVTPRPTKGMPSGPMADCGQVGHLLDQRLPEELQLAGDARGDLGPHAQPEAEHDGGGDERGPDHVQVDGQAGDVHHAVVLADRDVAAGQHEAGGSLDPLRDDDAARR